MRSSVAFVAPLLAIMFAAIGCRTDFTAEIAATDSLMGVLTKVENVSEQIDPRLVKQYRKDVAEKCLKIQNELIDTLEMEEAQRLVAFCALDEHLQSCLDRKERIDAEVVRTRNQLFNLRTDLNEGSITKDSVNNYIEQEFLYVESLSEGAEQVVVELNGCFRTYGELKEEIDRFIIALPKTVDEVDKR